MDTRMGFPCPFHSVVIDSFNLYSILLSLLTCIDTKVNCNCTCNHRCIFPICRAKYNLPKNRYADVLCLDQSRVKLPLVDGDPSSDYINANYVDGYMQKSAYISSQGRSEFILILALHWITGGKKTCDSQNSMFWGNFTDLAIGYLWS